MLAGIGRYGPYVKCNKKYVSIAQDDPHTITLERALEVIAEQAQRDANKVIQEFEPQGIRVLNGRYGPYITDAPERQIPKDANPRTDPAGVEELIEAAPAKKTGTKKAKVPAQGACQACPRPADPSRFERERC